MATKITFLGFVHKLLADMDVKAKAHNPSQSNTSQLIGTALFWDTVQSFSKKQSDIAWKKLEEEEIIDTDGLTEGEHVLAENKDFVVTGKMSAPYKSFSADALAAILLKTKYKVPVAITKDACEKAKIPGKGRLTLNIIEK